jgi:hypothetical protein
MKLRRTTAFFFIPLLMTLSLTVRSQDSGLKNSISVGVNRSFFSTGDLRGWGLGFGYDHAVSNRFDIGGALNVSFASSNRINRASDTGAKYPVIMEGVENAFPDFFSKDKDYIERGIASYPGSSERLLYLTADIIANYRVVNKERHIVKIGLGGSFGYAEESSTTLDIEGTFDGRPFIEENTPVRMVVPAYARWIDLGFVANLEYMYKLSDRTIVGLRGKWHNFLGGGDWIYSGGLVFGVGF